MCGPVSVRSMLERCIDAQHSLLSGCDTITWNFTRGLNNTRGALFALNVGFTPAAGKLRQIPEGSIGKLHLPL